MDTKEKVQKPLPKWFNGDVYPKGGTVENIFTGEPAELNANELSMYDFIMGATMILERTNFASQKLINEMRKGIDWFRSANPSAYMTLLD
jgi:hypothetical protein